MDVKEVIQAEVHLKEEFQIDRGSGDPPSTKNGGGHNFNGPSENSEESRRNAFIAMILFLGTDYMLFAGLIGAFIVFKFGAEIWPPSDQPRLPLNVTTINTFVLLLSGGFMIKALRLLKNR